MKNTLKALETGDPSPLSHGRALMCPVCGGDNLSHVGVEVFWRDREDAETGIHVSSGEGLPAHIDIQMTANPSARRDGLKIRFVCESGCHNSRNLSLLLRQHKGTTYIEWDD